jgi:uncharacterized membrane protein
MDININFNKNSKKIKLNFILIAILTLAAILRFYHLGFQSPWLDELSTLKVSDPDLTFDNTDLLVMTREGFPHLYFLSLKFLSIVFGHTILTLRLFSAIFGLLSIYVTYLLNKELINEKAGYISAILIAVNGFHIYHSQEARAYTLLVFFIVFATYRMIKYIKDISWINAILLGLACGLIPNAHPLGVLNIAVIYSTLLVFFILSKEKLIIFKQLFVSLILTLLVFVPVYQIISKVSKITSFWTPPASLEQIKQAFFELFGSNMYVFYIYIISILIFFIAVFFKIKSTESISENKLNYIFLTLVFFWITINIGVIIVKSYLGISIILNRYFIGSFPLFIITLSYCLSLIKNKYILSSLIIVFMVISLYSLIYQRAYYTSVSKSEWNIVSSEIIKNNPNNHKIYSAYGFVSAILFKNTNSQNLLTEVSFENYVEGVKSNSIQKESFWYFDGNFRPFNLNQEQQLFLKENYDLILEIDKYDCWARHYVLKGEIQKNTLKPEELSLKDFSSGILDGTGNLFMFENGTITSKELLLDTAQYEFTINANSLPDKPIDGENAHIVIMLNNIKVGEKKLSEKSNNKTNKITFTNPDNRPKKITVVFDNDLSKNNLDRNLVIYNVKLKKVEN